MGEPIMRQVKDRADVSRAIPSPLTGLRILVIEDEGLFGVLVEQFLDRFGCQIVGPAANMADAMQMIRTATIDVAVIDLEWQGEMAYPLADALIAMAVPLVFATGLPANQIEDRYWHVPVVGKPFEEGELRGALLEAMDRRVAAE
jgi:DNA-binding response OmpR family regulator